MSSNPMPVDDGWTAIDLPGFTGLVGPFWRRDTPEGPRFRIQVEAKHLNQQGRTHGGMLATLFDNALGFTVIDAAGGRPCVTVQLGVHFIAGGKCGDIVEARTRIVRQTRSLVFVEGSMSVGDTEIATASGVWKILSNPTPPLRPEA